MSGSLTRATCGIRRRSFHSLPDPVISYIHLNLPKYTSFGDDHHSPPRGDSWPVIGPMAPPVPHAGPRDRRQVPDHRRITCRRLSTAPSAPLSEPGSSLIASRITLSTSWLLSVGVRTRALFPASRRRGGKSPGRNGSRFVGNNIVNGDVSEDSGIGYRLRMKATEMRPVPWVSIQTNKPPQTPIKKCKPSSLSCHPPSQQPLGPNGPPRLPPTPQRLQPRRRNQGLTSCWPFSAPAPW